MWEVDLPNGVERAVLILCILLVTDTTHSTLSQWKVCRNIPGFSSSLWHCSGTSSSFSSTTRPSSFTCQSKQFHFLRWNNVLRTVIMFMFVSVFLWLSDNFSVHVWECVFMNLFVRFRVCFDVWLCAYGWLTAPRSSPFCSTSFSFSSSFRIVLCKRGALAPLSTATSSPPWPHIQGSTGVSTG